VGGIVLLVVGWPNVLFIVLGLLAIGIAIVIRPRSAELPGIRLPREQSPTLTRFASHVAETVGTRAADEIRVGPDFNASVFTRGWRRTRYLYLRLPLFTILESS